MPELPEVETVRRTLSDAVVGRAVERVEVRRADVVVTGSPGCDTLLSGDVIERVDRHGKQVAVVGRSGACVCIHLGMSGRLCVDPRPLPTHAHVVWQFTSAGAEPGQLVFSDARRFGGVWSFGDVAGLWSMRWSRLGPDALLAESAGLFASFQRTTRGLKAVLLDQSVLAGLGNIYVDELLWATRWLPGRPACSLGRAEVATLVRAMRRLLGRAVEAGGSTLRDYVDAHGQAGGFQTLHRAYGRAGQPCHRCQTPMTTDQLAGRTTVWCPTCQR